MTQVFDHPDLYTETGILVILASAGVFAVGLVFGFMSFAGISITGKPRESVIERVIRISLVSIAFAAFGFVMFQASSSAQVPQRNIELFEEYYGVEIDDDLSTMPDKDEPKGTLTLSQNTDPDTLMTCDIALVDTGYKFLCTDASSVIRELIPVND